MINKETVKNNFSKYARHYDVYSNIQNLSASELIIRVEQSTAGRILEIGCGTGNYTMLLRQKFPHAIIKAVDISPQMIEVAAEKLKDYMVDFIAADAGNLYLDEKFDLITSNASFHWFEDLERALTVYKGLLEHGGNIAFSIFGPKTFQELDESLREFRQEKAAISSRNFLTIDEVRHILGQLFTNTEAEEKVYTESYGSLSELLKKIKYTGTRGESAGVKKLWTPNSLAELERIYKKKYGGITAAYQVFFCKGKNQ